MELDPERASFVSQAFRYEVKTDSGVQALYPNSKIIEINTNLDVVAAKALAMDIFNVSSKSARTFTVTVEGVLTLDEMVSGAPRYYLRFNRHDAADPSVIYTVIAAKVKHVAQTTELTVRG
jgi:hypothetical protein